jgi:hypothetical protein
MGRRRHGKPHKQNRLSKQVIFSVTDCRYEVVQDLALSRGFKIIDEDETEENLQNKESNSSMTHSTPSSPYLHSSLASSAHNTGKPNFYWVDICTIQDRFSHLQGWQMINHFPGMSNIARKNRMAQHLSRMRRKFSKEYNFYPKTWVLPSEASDFRKQFYSPKDKKKASNKSNNSSNDNKAGK